MLFRSPYGQLPPHKRARPCIETTSSLMRLQVQGGGVSVPITEKLMRVSVNSATSPIARRGCSPVAPVLALAISRLCRSPRSLRIAGPCSCRGCSHRPGASTNPVSPSSRRHCILFQSHRTHSGAQVQWTVQAVPSLGSAQRHCQPGTSVRLHNSDCRTGLAKAKSVPGAADVPACWVIAQTLWWLIVLDPHE